MKRILVVGGVVLVLAVAGILWFVSSRLDSMVAQLIETHGSQATGTAVRVGSVSIDVTGGRGTIRGLRVANPKGYSRGDAFELGEITLGIDLGSIQSSPIPGSTVLARKRIDEPNSTTVRSVEPPKSTRTCASLQTPSPSASVRA